MYIYQYCICIYTSTVFVYIPELYLYIYTSTLFVYIPVLYLYIYQYFICIYTSTVFVYIPVLYSYIYQYCICIYTSTVFVYIPVLYLYIYQYCICIYTSTVYQGPVVQRVISLTNSLVVKMLTALVSTIANSQLFLLKNVSSFCKCKNYKDFFSKNTSIYAIFNDESFNDMLTNDISFE